MTTKVLKDEALEKYYSALFGMYGSPGWKCLMEDLARMHETHDSISAITTEAQLWFRKGEIAQMEWALTHQGTVEATYAMLISDQEGGEEEAPTGGIAKVIE
jgi:hypothetical protein